VNEQKPKPAWRRFVGKLADKLLDAGNIVFGALIVGQLLSGKPFDWGVALLGLGAWVVFVMASYVMVYLSRGDD